MGKKGEPVCIDDEIPFDIPDSWEWCCMNQYLDVRDGTHDTPKYVTQGVPLVTSKNLNNGKIDFSTAKFISEEDHQQISQRSQVDDNDILFAMIGTIGNPVKVSKDRNFSIKNVGLFKPFVDETNMNYVFYYLLFVQNKMRKNASGAVQSFVSLTVLRNYYIPIPPLEEQKRIVDKFEKFLPLLEEYNINEKGLTKLNTEFPKKLKKSILQEAIQGKLVSQDSDDEPASILLEKIREEKERLIKEKKIKRNKNESYIFKENNHFYEKVDRKGEPVCIDDELPFDIPDSWEWGTLGNILSVMGGKRVPKGYKLLDEPTPYIYIRVTNMKNGTIEKSNLKYIDENVHEQIKNYTIGKDDLYITVAGTIGNVGSVPEFFDGMNLTENANKLTNIFIDKEFLKYILSSNYIQNQLIDKTTKVAQPKLAIKRILSTKIAIPPLNEQKRIVNKLKVIFKELKV